MIGKGINNFRYLAFSLMLGGLLSIGLLLLLKGNVLMAQAKPGILFARPGGAGTECSQANPCDLQTALAQASDGDTIYLAQGTYTGAGAAVITLTRSITLYGGWNGSSTVPVVRDPQAYQTVLDGEGVRRSIYISGTIAPVLDGLIVSDGNATGLGGYESGTFEYDAGGGIYINKAGAVISNCVIINSTAGTSGTGGGLFLLASNARVENSSVVSNTAAWGGGARVVRAAPLIQGSRFLSNTASFGGGLYLTWSKSTVAGNVFRNNWAGNGGALYLSGDRSTVLGNLIEDNQGSYGAGIGIASGLQAVISGNLLLSNTATYEGGGIRITYNDADVRNNVLAHNGAAKGAGIYILGASPRLRHNTLAQNSGGNGEGILVATNARVAMTNTILVSHTVGISVTTGSTATLEATLWGSGARANGTDWGGDGAILTGTVNVWDDPGFVNPSGNDYHLAEGSAAIDAGVDAGVATDIDGQSRDASPDIGADEFAVRTYLPLVMK